MVLDNFEQVVECMFILCLNVITLLELCEGYKFAASSQHLKHLHLIEVHIPENRNYNSRFEVLKYRNSGITIERDDAS